MSSLSWTPDLCDVSKYPLPAGSWHGWGRKHRRLYPSCTTRGQAVECHVIWRPGSSAEVSPCPNTEHVAGYSASRAIVHRGLYVVLLLRCEAHLIGEGAAAMRYKTPPCLHRCDTAFPAALAADAHFASTASTAAAAAATVYYCACMLEVLRSGHGTGQRALASSQNTQKTCLRQAPRSRPVAAFRSGLPRFIRPCPLGEILNIRDVQGCAN